jgi:drug/metabolite transporter (DMT)-like permease
MSPLLSDDKSKVSVIRLTPIQLLILAVLITGVGPVLVRESPVGPASTAFWRLMIALPLSFWLSRKASRLSLRDTGWALLAGVLLACDLVLWNNAILSTSVMEATVLVMLFPLIVAGFEIGFFGRRLAPKLLVGGATAFVGTALIAFSASRSQSSLIGDLMAIGAAVFYAGSMLISAALCQRVDNRSVTPWVIVGGACGTLPMIINENVSIAHDLYGWAYLGLYGTITFASYALYSRP